MRACGEVQESEKEVEFPGGAFQGIVLVMSFRLYLSFFFFLLLHVLGR